MLQNRQLLCIWWHQLAVVFYELLKTNELIAEARDGTQFMRLTRVLKKKLQDNARPHVAVPVKTYLDMGPFDFHSEDETFFRNGIHMLPESGKK